MLGGAETIKPYVDEIIKFAKQHKVYKFLVTRIGCGIAGFKDEEIAPLFDHALDVENVILPKEFADIINDRQDSFIRSFDYWSDRSADNW